MNSNLILFSEAGQVARTFTEKNLVQINEFLFGKSDQGKRNLDSEALKNKERLVNDLKTAASGKMVFSSEYSQNLLQIPLKNGSKLILEEGISRKSPRISPKPRSQNSPRHNLSKHKLHLETPLGTFGKTEHSQLLSKPKLVSPDSDAILQLIPFAIDFVAGGSVRAECESGAVKRQIEVKQKIKEERTHSRERHFEDRSGDVKLSVCPIAYIIIC